MRYYTSLKLGPNREKTPEGFLLCKNVPLARTGMQLYGPGETPIQDGRDGVTRIHRRPEDVFSENTMASFIGKPLTIEHPEQDVTPENWKQLAVGVILDTRRGVGIENDLMLGDVLVTDADAISRILDDGVEEVSCGYDAEYEEQEPGVGYQTSILGNHVALVPEGRCGPRCSIRDSEGEMTLAEKIRKAFTTQDNAGLEAALAAIPAPVVARTRDEDEGGATHVHIHTEGAPAAVEDEPDDPIVPADPPLDPNAGRLDAVERTVAEILSRLDAMMTSEEPVDEEEFVEDEESEEEEDDDEEKTDDEGNPFEKKDDEDKEKKSDDSAADTKDAKTKKAKLKLVADAKRAKIVAREVAAEVPEELRPEMAKARDSRYMEESIQQTIATAEILSPGISLPEFKASATPAKTLDALTGLRKKAISIANATTHGASMIAELRGGRPLTLFGIDRLSTHDTRDLFFNAGHAMKQANRKAVSDGTVAMMQSGEYHKPTLAELNKINKEFWAKRA